MFCPSALEPLQMRIEAVRHFLDSVLPLLNSHNVDFFCQENNYWNSFADRLHHNDSPATMTEVLDAVKNLAKKLSAKPTLGDIFFANRLDFSHIEKENFDGLEINDLVAYISRLSVDAFGFSASPAQVVLHMRSLGMFSPNKNVGDKIKLDKIMPEKKTHEVEEMSLLVHKLAALSSSAADNAEPDNEAASQTINFMIDMGSGKGYLPSYLNRLYNYNVLGIEASGVNIDGSCKRSERIEKIWPNLLRRANERAAAGDETERRGKRWKRREHKRMRESEPGEESQMEISTDDTDTSTKGATKYVSSWVSADLNLDSILQETFPKLVGAKFGIIGLHTCGGLAVESIKVFLRHEKAKFLCIAPCCYHLLDEPQDVLGVEKTMPAVNIPLSRYLKSTNFNFGRTARMLSSYSPHRLARSGVENNLNEADGGMNQFPLPNTLIYRSILQKLLVVDKGISGAKVGRVRGTYATFAEYVHAIIEKNNLQDLNITDEDVDRAYKSVEDRIESFQKFILVKAMFAPLLESLILMDQLAFVIEHAEIQTACIVQMFDPKISPRSHAIFAWKH